MATWLKGKQGEDNGMPNHQQEGDPLAHWIASLGNS
jgi:hypothetical protein